MEMALVKDDLWPTVREERLRPVRPPQDVRKWDSDARKATGSIMLSLDKGAEQYVKGIRNSSTLNTINIAVVYT
jgi:hypothetical protein